MLQAEDPYGEWDSVCDIIRAIREHDAESMVCATWGNHGQHRGRAAAFREGARRMGLKLHAYAMSSLVFAVFREAAALCLGGRKSVSATDPNALSFSHQLEQRFRFLLDTLGPDEMRAFL
jgi:hypothetical protein